ncbi:MAG: 1,2-phenylacetyl-CoA epoxidase subunit PaaC [Granulosicoccus sp.]
MLDNDKDAVVQFLLRMGDNNLVLSHRLSEWCGHAPALEEDIALANTALDCLGQAQLWLELAGVTQGCGQSADDLAFFRDSSEFRNVLLVEQPNGDYAETLVRQFLFDAWHLPMMNALKASSLKAVSDIAEKATPEITYHLERSTDLMIRLGDGNEESHTRMQNALNRLWPYATELLISDEIDNVMAESLIAPQLTDIKKQWSVTIEQTLQQATLVCPPTVHAQQGGKRGVHTENLGFILAQMQYLQRSYPGSRW